MKNLIPLYILEKYQQQIYNGSFTAYSMFVDISGFTAMTEQLSLAGTAGAEELSDILKFLFSASVDAVYDNGGFITTFAGDAFTALFIDDHKQSGLATNFLNAAYLINSFFAKNKLYCSKYGTFSFGVKIGLDYGRTEWEIIDILQSDSKTRAAYFFRGPAVDGCAKAEHQANIGEIVLSSAVVAEVKLDLNSLIDISNAKYYKISANNLLPSLDLNKKMITDNDNTPYRDFLEKFTGRSELNFPIGEFRDVISVFISFAETDNMAEFLKVIFSKREIFGGSHPKVDFGDKGGTILLFFGAPVAYENNVERALKFALTLFEDLKNDYNLHSLKIRAGIADGLIYSGFNGSDRRSEFTCLGNAVNQSARFMMKADWNEILLTENLSKNHGFKFEHKGDFEYKGRSQKIATYNLTAAVTSISRSYSGKIVGRDADLASLLKLLDPLIEGQNGGIVLVEGSSGTGKTRLVHELQQMIRQENDLVNKNLFRLNWLEMPCDELVQSSYNPLLHFLNHFFAQSDLKSKEENKTAFEKNFDNLLEQISLNCKQNARYVDLGSDITTELLRTKSFIGGLLDLNWENSPYEQFDAKGRADNIIIGLENLFKACAVISPLLLFVDDIHWIDKESLTFFNLIGKKITDLPIIIIATSRLADDGSGFDFNFDSDIVVNRFKLANLTPEAIGEIASFRLNPLPEMAQSAEFKQTVEFICEKSGGNPFYAEQIIIYLLDNDLLDGNFRLKDEDVSATGNLNSIIIARIDRMENQLADMVKTASVLGKEFAVDVLSAMLINISGTISNSFQNNLKHGEKENIWSMINEIKCFFKHAMIRDVAYQMQLVKRLKNLHQYAAETMEKLYHGSLNSHFSSLAYHYDKADNYLKALEFLAKAGNLEKDNYRNSKALEFYNRWIDIANLLLDIKENDYNSVQVTEQNRELVIKYIETNVLYRCMIYSSFMAKHDTAQEILNNSLILAEKTGDKNMLGLVFVEMGNMAMKTNKIEIALEYASKALSLYQETKNMKKICTCTYLLGLLAYRKGKIDEAILFLEQSVQTAIECNEKKDQAKALSSLGIMYDYKGDLDKAVELYQNRLKISNEIGNDKLGMQVTLGNLAIVYSIKGEHQKALTMFEDKLKICQELGDKRGQAIALENMGIVLETLERSQEAISFLNKAKVLAYAVKDYKEVGNILLSLANNHVKLKNKSTAYQLFEEAEDIIFKHDIINLKPNFYLNKAEFCLFCGERGSAAELGALCLKTAAEINKKEYIKKAEQFVEKL